MPPNGNFRQLPPPPRDSGDWTCPQAVTGCPIHTKKAAVYLPLDMYNKFTFLANEIQTEWIAYLQGRLIPGKEYQYLVTGFYFPMQKANGGHCEPTDEERANIPEGTIATIHSHVNMGAFFSTEDKTHFNWPIELVINARGEMKADGLTLLDCGRPTRGEADIFYTECDEAMTLVNQVEDKIVKDEPQAWIPHVQQTT